MSDISCHPGGWGEGWEKYAVQDMTYWIKFKIKRKGYQQWTHLNSDAMINAEPEEQQSTQEESLKESI